MSKEDKTMAAIGLPISFSAISGKMGLAEEQGNKRGGLQGSSRVNDRNTRGSPPRRRDSSRDRSRNERSRSPGPQRDRSRDIGNTTRRVQQDHWAGRNYDDMPRVVNPAEQISRSDDHYSEEFFVGSRYGNVKDYTTDSIAYPGADIISEPTTSQNGEKASSPSTSQFLVQKYLEKVKSRAASQLTETEVMVRMANLDGFITVYTELIDTIARHPDDGLTTLQCLIKLIHLHETRPVSVKRLATTEPSIPDMSRVYNKVLANLLMADDERNLKAAALLSKHHPWLNIHQSIKESLRKIIGSP